MHSILSTKQTPARVFGSLTGEFFEKYTPNSYALLRL